MGEMPKKRKKKFKAVKALARERLGTPRPGQLLEDGRNKTAEKHKKNLSQLLSEEQ
jgi:hypothetical protein